MSVSHKSSNAQMFRLMVYGRPLHPELFPMEGRRTYRGDHYEVESWIVPAGHMVRFAAEGETMAEVVIENGDHLPENGLVYALPCIGEKDYEHDPSGKIGYVTTIQTETLTDNLYNATMREMRDFAAETDSLSYAWTDPDGAACLTVLDAQRYKREYHIQSYHLLGSNGIVLRTQSIFEVL